MKHGGFRRFVCLSIAVIILAFTVACGGSGGGSQTNLTGTADDVLVKLLSDIEAAGVEMPMGLPPSAVPPDISQNTVGLSTADFNRLVASSSYSLAAIGTFAHQIIVLQGNDAAAAVQIKDIVSKDGGYDPQKWICVWPDRVIAVDSGAYVLIVASYNDVVDAAIAAFKADAGTTGDVITFWEHSGDAGDIEIGGMAPLPIG